MGVRAILSQCNMPFWFDVASKLADEHGWDIRYWIGNPKNEKKVRERFPKAIFHSAVDARFAIAPPEWKGIRLAAIDKKILGHLSPHESMVYRMMEGFGLSFRDRVQQYYSLLRYWIAVLELVKPDIVLFPVSPHVLYDYVLYLLCELRGIKTIMFQFTSLPRLIFATGSIEEGSSPLVDKYQKLLTTPKSECVQLSKYSEEYMNNLLSAGKGGMSPVLKYRLENDGNAKSKYNLYHRISQMVKRQTSNVSKAMLMIKVFLKLQRNSVDPKHKQMYKATGLQYLNSFFGEKRRKRLYGYYNRVSKEVTLDKPYVYVALHSQPERSTKPDGGVFIDQFLIVDMLSSMVPDGWEVYVKEHKGQYKFKRAELGRTKYFYDDIVSLHNVKMLPLSMESYELIDNAEAIATVSGSSGWEAVIRGKPAMVFGNAWYRGCEGVFHTTTKRACKDALEKISSGYNVDRKKVKLFIKALETVGIEAYITRIHEKITKIPYDQNVSRITEAIRNSYNGLN